MALDPYQNHRPASRGPNCTLAFIMFDAAAIGIRGNTDIEGVVRTAEDVAEVHSRVVPLDFALDGVSLNALYLASSSGSGNHFLNAVPLGKLGTPFP
jgi:hypothetical protein